MKGKEDENYALEGDYNCIDHAVVRMQGDGDEQDKKNKYDCIGHTITSGEKADTRIMDGDYGCVGHTVKSEDTKVEQPSGGIYECIDHSTVQKSSSGQAMGSDYRCIGHTVVTPDQGGERRSDGDFECLGHVVEKGEEGARRLYPTECTL